MQDHETVPYSQAEQSIEGAERIGKELLIVVDSREPPASQEVSAQQLLPHVINGLDLREKPVSSNIKIIVPIIDRP